MAWDAAKPAGNSKIRDGDDVIRDNNVALEDALNREHEFPGGFNSTAGMHTFPVVNVGGYAIEGRLIILKDQLTFYSNGSWRFQGFEAGTAMAFFQSAAPLHWTQYTGYNDRVIRIVSGGGGGYGGDWSFGGAWADGHALTYDEMPWHTHGLHGTGASSGSNTVINDGGGGRETAGAGGGAAHYHTLNGGTWRPAYIDCIICVKDSF